MRPDAQMSRRKAIAVAGAAMVTTVPVPGWAKWFDEGWTVKFLRPHPFNLASIQKRLGLWWDQVLREMEALEKSTDSNVVEWRTKLRALPKGQNLALLKSVNKLVNATVRYDEDWHIWRKKDWWNTPLEAFTKGGDCEDFALTKGVSLWAKGWPADKLFLVAGSITYRGQKVFHMVLAAETDKGRLWVLDNFTTNVWTPSGNKDYFTPIYAVNGFGEVLFRP